jgi:hypothetical protein
MLKDSSTSKNSSHIAHTDDQLQQEKQRVDYQQDDNPIRFGESHGGSVIFCARIGRGNGGRVSRDCNVIRVGGVAN